jgi:hypothetical protein
MKELHAVWTIELEVPTQVEWYGVITWIQIEHQFGAKRGRPFQAYVCPCRA